MWEIISLPLTCVTRIWWSLQATPTDTGMCCSFNLKSGLKDGKYKWAPWLVFFIFNSNTNTKMGKMTLLLHHSISFTRQILADLQNSSAPTTVNQVNCFFDLCFEKPFTGATSDDPSAWLWQGDLIKTDKTELYIRVSHLSLIGTHTKCLQLQWRKTSKVKYQRCS